MGRRTGAPRALEDRQEVRRQPRLDVGTAASFGEAEDETQDGIGQQRGEIGFGFGYPNAGQGRLQLRAGLDRPTDCVLETQRVTSE